MSDKVRAVIDEIKEFYLNSQRSLVIACSFGKDSMTVVELFMLALSELPLAMRTRKVVIESVDTLVEAPPMRDYLKKQIQAVKRRIRSLKLPMEVVQLKPDVHETFFVNVIGKGYKSPDAQLRWCTDRLKIQPVKRFVLTQISLDGGICTVTGQRRAESINRARTMDKYNLEGKFQRDGSNPNSIIYTPIEDWTTEDVWDFLRANNQFVNDRIEAFYEEANENGDIYQSNRLGCWTCTVVRSDNALQQFCGHGYDLTPLLRYRQLLKDYANDKIPGILSGEKVKQRFRSIPLMPGLNSCVSF